MSSMTEGDKQAGMSRSAAGEWAGVPNRDFPAFPEAYAHALLQAHKEGWLLTPISDELDLSLEMAYRIQSAGMRARLGSGDQLAGWKLGYTSAAMRTQMGVDQPNVGPLYQSMVLRDGERLGAVVQPKVEPEICIQIGEDVPIGRVRNLEKYIEGYYASIEVVDSVFENYKFTLEDNTADGSSAAFAVLGQRIDTTDLSRCRVRFEVDGQLVGEATGAAALGGPTQSLAWLVEQLSIRGDHLQAGQIVLTGGLTAAADLPPGAIARAVFDDTWEVGVSRAAST